MIPKYNKVHNRFKLNGYHFDRDGLLSVAYSFIKEGDHYEKDTGDFLLNWMDDNNFIEVRTSGSTGTPKTIKLDKQAMVRSAIATGDYFGLESGHRALHCLPTHYIAGKMMLVRAIILGLEIDIVTPSSFPMDFTKGAYDFCAMVPFQLSNSVVNLDRIKKLIVGGAVVSTDLVERIQSVETKIYETYGMTETITHIAARPINHLSTSELEPFTIFPNVAIETDERGCLVITADYLNVDHIVTNDVVELVSENQFKLLGRYDNVINSGGIKIFPELIEDKLSGKIDTRFFIAAETDKELGEKIVLVLESDNNKLDTTVFDNLDKYEVPKQIYCVENFAETNSGKIQRTKTLTMLK
jgi:O-succinylbenzoic acid--CoA ligase